MVQAENVAATRSLPVMISNCSASSPGIPFLAGTCPTFSKTVHVAQARWSNRAIRSAHGDQGWMRETGSHLESLLRRL